MKRLSFGQSSVAGGVAQWSRAHRPWGETSWLPIQLCGRLAGRVGTDESAPLCLSVPPSVKWGTDAQQGLAQHRLSKYL